MSAKPGLSSSAMCTQHASNNGLRLTVHAGETVGPEGIWGALLELKPDRIGHGLARNRRS